MSKHIKSSKAILDKLGIEKRNPMQEEAHLAITSCDHVILLSPTGTGKTIAFLVPILETLDPECTDIQCLILVPSRELAIQIEHVIREMGTGYKTNAVYGGRSISKDKIDLKHAPAILIGTPGRVADHLRKETFNTTAIHTLVLDEFDKSLEVGFEHEMTEIITALPHTKRKILTSATQEIEIPLFVGLQKPLYINYLEKGTASQLQLKTVHSPSKDKLETLVQLLCHIGNHPGIIFCNYKDSIQRVSDFLSSHQIQHGCFYGGMEQKDRERTLIKFRNGTHRLIIATDLAARGLDINELRFIIHYQMPLKKQEFTHRNGRTARMNAEGTAYMLQWEQENVPDFITSSEIEQLTTQPLPKVSTWSTLFISGGRKDKISKGDIAGVFFKQGKLKPNELGNIELKQDCAFVAVPKSKANRIMNTLNDIRIKKKKVRLSII